MNELKKISCGIAAILISHLSFAATAFDFQADGAAFWEYSRDGLGTAADLRTAGPDPLLDPLADDTPVYGLGVLLYEVLNLAVSPSFALDTVYDWCIQGSFEYDYAYQFAGPGTTPLPPVLNAGGDSFDFEFTASVAELTESLLGASPLEIFAVISTLPEAGSLAELIASINAAAGTGFVWPFETTVSSDSILYAADLGVPFGSIDLGLIEPVEELVSTDGILFFDVAIQAKVPSTRPIPDAGMTGLLALVSLGSLFIARKGFTDKR